MVYLLNYVGGPNDGRENVYSVKPYDGIKEPDGSIYMADEQGEACLEWVDDETRRITLKYRGNARDGVELV